MRRCVKVKPDDSQLLTSEGRGGEANCPADAAKAYRHASRLKPGDAAIKTKLANAEALEAATRRLPPAIAPRRRGCHNAPSGAPRPPKKPPALASAKRAAPRMSPAIAALDTAGEQDLLQRGPPGPNELADRELPAAR